MSKLRVSAFIALATAIVALVLTMLVIFAGSKKGLMEDSHMLTLNTSRFGQGFLNDVLADNNTTQDCSKINKVLHPVQWGECEADQAIQKAGNALKDTLKEAYSDAVGNISKALNIHDFYSAHILDYCEGYYQNTTAGGDKGKNVTSCSNQTALHNFDPKQILQSELRSGINISELQWPDEVDKAIHAVNVASKVMFVMYCMGAGFAGLAVATFGYASLAGGRLSAVVNVIIATLGFICLLIPSAISTAIIDKTVKAVNKYGSGLGLSAFRGKSFLGMTWAATGCMFVAIFLWGYLLFRGPRGDTGSSHRRSYRKSYRSSKV